MKTLEEHNKEKQRIYENLNFNEPIKNGIECPACKRELYDSCSWMTLTSNPPQKRTHCVCGYKGLRVV